MKYLSYYLICLSIIIPLQNTSAQGHTDTEPLSKARVFVFPGTDGLRLDILCDKEDELPAKLYGKVISTMDGYVLWEGTIDLKQSRNSADKLYSAAITNLKPHLWSTSDPYLYEFNLKLFKNSDDLKSIRIGFRSMTSDKGRILLNGNPVFLRGVAINPPGRGIPYEVERSRDFAYQYVKYMKSLNVNIIRIPDVQAWYDVCDELGMMVFGGNYSGRVMGENPPKEYEKAINWYKYDKIGPLVHHPSLVIYALTNEVPYRGKLAVEWLEFLNYAFSKLRHWDTNRLIIGNAGYGYGQSGDICDLHRYWGWYYSSPYTFLNLRDYDSITFPGKIQPVTFSECVGNYTGPDGRYNLTPNHKNPVSQQCWTGHIPQKYQSIYADRHQVFTVKTAIELYRRLRTWNRELSGIFPFTILFHNWHTVNAFSDMEPKPAAQQLKTSYQPVLLSWENWTINTYSGFVITPRIHIVNDMESLSDLENLTIVYELRDKAQKTWLTDSILVSSVPYYSTVTREVSIEIPGNLVTGNYDLLGRIIDKGKIISSNKTELFISGKEFVLSGNQAGRSILVYDPVEATANALRQYGYSFRKIIDFQNIKPGGLIIVGEGAMTAVNDQDAGQLKKLVKNGTRIILLKQDRSSQGIINDMLPVEIQYPDMDLDDPSYPPPERPSAKGSHINPERQNHPVFIGLDKMMLEYWSDYTGWDESMQGMPSIYPVTGGFVLKDKTDLSQIAILANYSVGLEGIALAEVFHGKGSYLLCGFDLLARILMDPVAGRLFVNTMNYMSDKEVHILHPEIDGPILWGDYESEKGLLTGIYSGLILNTYPVLTGSYREKKIVVTEDGHLFAEKPGGWNNQAGIQYVPYGRRPFGPYHHRGFGGIPEPLDLDSDQGSGVVWLSIPEIKKTITNKVWNPAEKDLILEVHIKNTKIGEHLIQAGQLKSLRDTLPATGRIKLEFRGGRQLVLLETIFN